MQDKKIYILLPLFIIPIILMGLIFVVDRKEKQEILKKLQNQENLIQDVSKAAEARTEKNAWITPRANPMFVPWRDWNVEEPTVNAKAAIVMEIKNKQDGPFEEKILFQENIQKPLPIASLTKLMTALVVADNMDLNKNIKITKEAVAQEGEAGKLVVGEELPVKTLLYAMLMESSNDAAFALASDIGVENFVGLMNAKAKNLQLKNTSFANPIGFDDPKNFSTAFDVTKILEYGLNNKTIAEALKTQSMETTDMLGKFFHSWKNTNKLLEALPNVVGGKTGLTNAAGGCVALAVNNPKNDSKIVSVLLGAEDENKRFEETKKLIDWVFKAYNW